MCVNSQQILFISADTDRLLSSQDISLGHPHSSFFSLDRIETPNRVMFPQFSRDFKGAP